MEAEEKYRQVWKDLDRIIARRAKAGIFAALGYTSNLDILCDFQMSVFNELLERYVPGRDLYTMKAAGEITCMREFLETVVFYCVSGIGGEVDISDFGMIRNLFKEKNGMGGTATQGAMALAAVGCPSIVHLTDDSPEVCSILDSPYIYTVSADGRLIHTGKAVQNAEQEIHYIIQFKKGDELCLGNQKIAIPASNRLIITKITVNETVPFSEPYFSYVEQNAGQIASNVLSSFNAIQSPAILRERLEYVKKHIGIYKSGYPRGIIYFEDAHYHNREVRKMCLETIYPYVDIVSLNEEELAYTLQMYGCFVDIGDILSCVKGTEYLLDRFRIQKGIVVHTKDYSMYVGERTEADMETGLALGNLLASAKAMCGWYGKREQLEEVMKLPLSPRGILGRRTVEEAGLSERAVLIPSKYMDQPKYTIGLGDSFVAGMQMCFGIA